MSADLLPWDVLAPKRRLFLAHLRGDATVRGLLGGRGIDDAAVTAAAEERRRIPLPHREALAKALGAPRLADARAVVVVGGQQPGVAGGPLLTVAKAIGVVALAARLERAGAGPVVPVWWVASEDHDLAEAGDVLLAAGKSGRELLRGTPSDRRMLSRVEAPTREAILGLLGDGPHRAEVERLLPAASGLSLGAHAAEILRALLGPRGLVVAESFRVRPFARSVFEKDVREPGALAVRVREGNALVVAAGFEAVLEDPEGALHFRADAEGRRTRGGGTEADLDALEASLSSDVALRVLVQDAALPVAAHVVGPSELEYLAAIHPARESLGIFAPCAVPRPGVTILEKRTEESLRDLGSDLAGLYRGGGASLVGGASAAPVPGEPLAAEARRLRGELDRAAGDAASHPPAVRSRLGRVRDGLEDLAAAVDRAAAERSGVGESRRRKVLEALLPDGLPQERKWSLLPFLLRHGPALWERMVADLSGPEPGHRVIRV